MDATEFLQVYRSVEERTSRKSPFLRDPFCDLCGMAEGEAFVYYAPMGQFVLMCGLCAKFHSGTDDGEW